MKTTKDFEKLKGLIEEHTSEMDKEKLFEYGSAALLFLSGVAGNKIIRTLVIGAMVIAAGKLAYDYLAERAEEADAA